MSKTIFLFCKRSTSNVLFTESLKVYLAVNGKDQTHYHLIFESPKDYKDALREFDETSRIHCHFLYDEDPFMFNGNAIIDELQSMEYEIGLPNIQRILEADRLFVDKTYFQKLNYFAYHYSYFKSLYSTYSCDYFMLLTPDSLNTAIFYSIGRQQGATPIVFVNSRFGNHFWITDNVFDYPPENLDMYEKIATADQSIRDDFEKWIARAQQPGYIGQRVSGIGLNLRGLLNTWRNFRVHKEHLYHFSFKFVLKRAILKRIRLLPWFLWLLTKKKQIDETKTYYFYPLNFEPEASIHVRGGSYLDQIELIELFSKVIPVGSYLIVKEHPQMPMGIRSFSFLRRLSKLDNVIPIWRTSHSSEWFVERSKAVFLINGTLGVEAAIKGWKVFLVGHACYETFGLEGVSRIENWKELSDLLVQIDDYQQKVDLKRIETVLWDKIGRISNRGTIQDPAEAKLMGGVENRNVTIQSLVKVFDRIERLRQFK